MAEITSVTTTWLPDDTATISGSGFGGDTGYVNLVFENLGRILECVVTDWTDTSITVTLLSDGFTSDEAVYLEAIGPDTNYFAARSEAAVTATPVIEPPAYLEGLTWVTVNSEALALLEPTPPRYFLTPLGQIWFWDEEAEQYVVRWYSPFFYLEGARDPALRDRFGVYSAVNAADIGVVGSLTLNRAFASGLLGQELVID